MLLTGNIFGEIDHCLRENGGQARQRRLQVELTLASESGELIEVSLHHFSRAGIGLIAGTLLRPGDRFSFKVPGATGDCFLTCEVFACRPTGPGFSISASFVAQERRRFCRPVESLN
jgi:hypothetical protein